MPQSGGDGELMTKVVLLFDDLRARPEALQYAVEFAARMDSVLVLLVLLCLEAVAPAADNGSQLLEETVEAAITPHLKAARAAGLTIEVVLRLGDQYSEMMKYLAETRTIQSIVWGGDETVLKSKTRRNKPHWLVRMRESIDCPVVIPVLKP